MRKASSYITSGYKRGKPQGRAIYEINKGDYYADSLVHHSLVGINVVVA